MEDATQILIVLSQVAMGLSLAACAGLRAFLPMLVVGLAGRMDWIPLTSHFEWLEATPALIVFGAAVVAELVADKVPWFDNFLDVAQTFVKPVAGVVVAAAVLHDLTPLQGTVLAIVLGAGTAGAVHLGKSGVRLASTAVTGGLANPVLSVVEEAGAWTLAIAAVWIPVITAVVVLILSILAFRAIRRRRIRSGTLRPA